MGETARAAGIIDRDADTGRDGIRHTAAQPIAPAFRYAAADRYRTGTDRHTGPVVDTQPADKYATAQPDADFAPDGHSHTHRHANPGAADPNRHSDADQLAD